jgi:hypothetical protein
VSCFSPPIIPSAHTPQSRRRVFRWLVTESSESQFLRIVPIGYVAIMLAMVASMGGVRFFGSRARRDPNQLNLVHFRCKTESLSCPPSDQIPCATQYDTGQVRLLFTFASSERLTCLQISDILLMDDFKLRFAQCGTAGDVSSCEFSRVREGLIVALLSIGTLIGALCGAPYVRSFQTDVHLRHNHQTGPQISLAVGMPCRWSVLSSLPV